MSIPLKEWLGAVPWLLGLPKNWRVARFKSVASLSTFDNSSQDDRLLSLSTSKGIVLKEYDDENRVRSGEDLRRYWSVRPGHLVVNPMWLAHGSIAASSIEGVISPDYRVYEMAPLIDPRYLALLLCTNEYRGIYDLFIRGNTTYDRRVSKDDFHSIPIVVPPLAQQVAIATFLNRKIIAIDALIAQKARLIEVLLEKRQGLITHAVTKGLDPNAPMKESGIPWIGQIPQHWAVKPVRRLFRFLDGMRAPVEREERALRQGEFPYYGASGVVDFIDNYIFDEPLVLVCEDGWNLLLRNQLVARSLRAKAWVNNHAHVLRPHSGDVDYWAAAIEQAPFELFVTGMRQPKLTAAALKEVPVPAPPDGETHSIASYLRKRQLGIDGVKLKLEESIERLREHRQTLIAAAVTGKIDVSKEAA